MFENVNGQTTPPLDPWVSYKLTGELKGELKNRGGGGGGCRVEGSVWGEVRVDVNKELKFL